VKTVADRNRVAAYHNRLCWWLLSRGTDVDDLERRWNPKIPVFSEFFV